MITEKDRRLGDMDKELESLRNELSEPPVISGVTATRGNARAGSRVGSRAGSRGGPRGTTSSPRGTNSNARGAAVSNPRAQRLMETQISTLKSKNEGLSGKVSELEQEIGELKKNLRTAEAEIKKTKDAAGANKDARKFEVILLSNFGIEYYIILFRSFLLKCQKRKLRKITSGKNKFLFSC